MTDPFVSKLEQLLSKPSVESDPSINTLLNEHGSVLVAKLAKLPSLQCLEPTEEKIKEAVLKSSELEFEDVEKTLVRQKDVGHPAERKTVVVYDFEGQGSIQEVRDLFEGSDHAAKIISISLYFANHWDVTFGSEEEARGAAFWLTFSCDTFKTKKLRCKIKSDHIKKSIVSAPHVTDTKADSQNRKKEGLFPLPGSSNFPPFHQYAYSGFLNQGGVNPGFTFPGPYGHVPYGLHHRPQNQTNAKSAADEKNKARNAILSSMGINPKDLRELNHSAATPESLLLSPAHTKQQAKPPQENGRTINAYSSTFRKYEIPEILSICKAMDDSRLKKPETFVRLLKDASSADTLRSLITPAKPNRVWALDVQPSLAEATRRANGPAENVGKKNLTHPPVTSTAKIKNGADEGKKILDVLLGR